MADDADDRQDILFYDAKCPVCRVAVRAARRSPRGTPAFRIAPLGSATFLATLSDEQRRTAPDSLLIRTPDRRLLTRSDAVLHVLSRLGPFWRFLARVGCWVPRRLRDCAYDVVARWRPRGNS